jgi:hypothetical protein
MNAPGVRNIYMNATQINHVGERTHCALLVLKI